jgi:hypothetical protein
MKGIGKDGILRRWLGSGRETETEGTENWGEERGNGT